MMWTVDKLHETLRTMRAYGSELPNLEVKKALQGYPGKIAETLCAFSNMPDGGTIICGIDEAENFLPVGVYSINELEKAVSSTLRNHLTPSGNAEFTRLHVGDADVLVIEVAPLPLMSRPCYYKGKAYMRSSDGDYAMEDYEITRILASRERKNNDTIPVPGSSLADLDPDYRDRFISSARLTSQRLSTLPPELVLKRKSAVTPQGEQLTLAGLYALGDYPQQFYPSLKISGLVASESARNLDKLETDGPLPDMLEQALRWLVRNLRTSVVDDGQGGLKNETEIPAIVLRELVANALVHRALDTDTSHGKDVVLQIFPDRVVITNPGGLWAITTERLAETGHKTAVNAALYELCKLTQTPSGSRVIEGEGNGIYEAQKAMRQAGLPPIEFIDRGFQFTALIRRSPLASRPDTAMPAPAESSTDQVIYRYLLGAGEQTITQIVDATGLSRRQVDYNLNKLLERGQVVSRPAAKSRANLYRPVGVEG